MAAGSSQANPFACIASGIAALWGPAHGGANEAVLRMLQDIGSRDNIPEAINRSKDKGDSFRCCLCCAAFKPVAWYETQHPCAPALYEFLQDAVTCV